jgi:hypothetical protein
MRSLVALAVVAVAAGFASADALVPPPKGKKFVSVSYEALASKDAVKGYILVTAATTARSKPSTPRWHSTRRRR